MATSIIGVKQSGASGTENLTESALTASFTDIYLVQSDDDTNAQQSVAATPGLPQVGNFWQQGTEINLAARCVNRRVRQITHKIWEVACQFSTSDSSSEDDGTVPPEQRQTVVSWSSETFEEVLEKDVKGIPLVNGVGEPLIQPKEVVIPVGRLERWELNWDHTKIKQYSNKVNDAAWWIYGPREVLMAGIEATREYIEDVEYYRVSYVIKIKETAPAIVAPPVPERVGWDLQLINQGTKYKIVVVNEETKPFVTGTGLRTTGFLKADGTRVDQGAGDPIEYLNFQQYEAVDFDALNLV